MTSRERVLCAIQHKNADRIPRDFDTSGSMQEKLLKHYGFSDPEQLALKFRSDIRFVGPSFRGRTLERYVDTDGLVVEESMFGYKSKLYPTGMDFCPMNITYPWDFAEEAADILNYDWISPDEFDYEVLKRQCDAHKDRALMIGVPGVYQFSTFMRSAENLYMDMAAEPELAHAIFDRFVDFELEYYERQFQAGDGQINLLRVCDDYGTQTGLLFSVPMWREFFKENTKKLAALAHKYGAYYMQHSCGAVRPIIPELIDCQVDLLDPIQKVTGMEPEGLKRDFGSSICFHGAIDTQWLLPGGTPQEVAAETTRYMDAMYHDGGYIVGPSQVIQIDIPVENVEAMYEAIDRYE